MKKLIATPLAVAALTLALAGCSTDSDDGGDSLPSVTVQTSGEDTIDKPRNVDRTAEEKPEPKPEKEEPSLTRSQENAIRSADSYLKFMAFSRTGLIEQLEYEGFSRADAVFAVDSFKVNWREQAAELAETYLDSSGFSRQGLIEQLEYEGFTYEQAVYGVNQTGL